jgi:rhodanese-related sulfurtransferase
MPAQVGREQVRRLIDEGGQLVEVLPPAEYAFMHLKGAVVVPLNTMHAENLQGLDRTLPVIVYCNDFQ